jgi:hypothetical protein
MYSKGGRSGQGTLADTGDERHIRNTPIISKDFKKSSKVNIILEPLNL